MLTQEQMDKVIDEGGSVLYGGNSYTDKDALREAIGGSQAAEGNPYPNAVPATNVDNSKPLEGEDATGGDTPAEQVAGEGAVSSEEVLQTPALTDSNESQGQSAAGNGNVNSEGATTEPEKPLTAAQRRKLEQEQAQSEKANQES